MQLHAFTLQPSQAPCNSMHATCNSMHSPCTLCMHHANSCMHHATSCIYSATPLKLNRLQITQSVLMHLESITKVFDFCLANCTCHQEPLHCWTLAPMHSCTCCQLWFTLQYPTLSLWSACINPTDHATVALWAPRSQVQFMRSTPSHESCP